MWLHLLLYLYSDYLKNILWVVVDRTYAQTAMEKLIVLQQCVLKLGNKFDLT